MRRWAIVVAALLTATACRTVQPGPFPLAPDDPRPDLLMAAWQRDADERRGLRGRARLAVDGRSGDVRLRGKQVLVLERPARLRVEIQGFLNQTAAVLVTDGERFELFRSEDRSYETGPVHPGLLWEQVHIALTPAEAIELLLGVPAPDPTMAPVAALDDGRGGVQLDLAGPTGRVRRRVGFDAAGRLRWIEVLDGGEQVAWRADFDDYAPVGGSPFAHEITLDVTAGGTHAEISLRDVELNPEIAPEVFQLRAVEQEPGG